MKSQESAKRYGYAVLNYGERFEDGYGFESKLDGDDVKGLVRAAAKHIVSESFWWADSGKGEMVIEVFKEDGLSLGVFGVHKKRMTSFSIVPKNKSLDSTTQEGRSHG